MDSSVSFEGLWSIISETRSVYSTEVVGQELQALKIKFSKGILYYQYSNDSTSAIKNDARTLFVCKIAESLGVSFDIASEVFTSYLVFNFRGTHHSLTTLLSSERCQEALLVSVWKFYHSERLYLLMCIRCVIEKKDDPSHPYSQLFKDFFSIINTENELLTSIIDQLDYACSVVVSSTGLQYLQQHQGTSGGGNLQSMWVSNMLKEQLQLVLCLMAFTEYCSRPINHQVVSLLNSFRNHGFGASPTFSHLFTEQHLELIRSVASMESILFTQCMRLNDIVAINDGLSPSEDFFTSADFFQNIDNILLGLGSSKEHGIILLAWLVVMFSLEKLSKTRLKSLIDQVGKLNVIAFIKSSLLKLPIVQSELTFVGGLVRRQLFLLLSAVLELFETENLCSREDLVELAAELFMLPDNAWEFWNQRSGFHILLQDLALEFPVCFDLLKLCAALLKSGTASVQKSIDLLSNAPHFAVPLESVPRHVYKSLEEVGGGLGVQLLEDHRAGGTPLLLPAGTRGVVVQRCGVKLISWRYCHSGWQYCMTLLDELFGETLTDLSLLQNRKVKVFRVIELLCALLRCGSREHAIQVRFLVTAIVSVLGGHFSMVSDDYDFFADCIALLTMYVSVDPMFVWNHLENFRLLPVGDAVLNSTLDSGRIGELIESRESVSHYYRLTCSFLELLVNSVSNCEVVSSSSFRSSVAFVLAEIFPNHTRWHFRSVSERLRIGIACLRLVHQFLHGSSSEVRSLVEHCLLNQSAGETLLDMVLFGESRINSLLEQQSDWHAGAGVLCIRQTQIALSSLNQLLLSLPECSSASDEKDNGQSRTGSATKRQISHLEKQLTAQPTSPNCPHPLLSIAQYVFHTHNPHLPTLAIRLLLRLADLFPMSLLASFGADSDAICDMMLTRLRCECEDVNLKRAIIDFVGSCARSQPGLLQCLIGQAAFSIPNQRKVESSVCSDAGFLDVLLLILQEHQQSSRWDSPMFVATAAALHSFWYVHCAAAVSYLSGHADFWSSLVAPLLTSISKVPVVVASDLLSVVTLQLFHLRRSAGDADERLRAAVTSLCSSSSPPLSSWSRRIVDVCREAAENCAESQASVFTLVQAWSEWWVLAADTPWCCVHVLDDLRLQVLTDLLLLCYRHVETAEKMSTRSTSCFLELFMLLSRSWHECMMLHVSAESVGARVSLADRVCALFDLASSRWRHLSRRSCVAVLTMLMQVLLQQTDARLADKCTAALIDILLMSLSEAHHLDAVLAVAGLARVVRHGAGKWLRLMEERNVMSVLLDVIGACMVGKQYGQLCASLLQLMVCAVSAAGGEGVYVCGEQLSRDVCLALLQAPDGVEWRPVWSWSVQLMSALLHSQPEKHWRHVLMFVSVHGVALCSALCDIQRCVDEQAVLQTEASARLLAGLVCSRRHVLQQWQLQRPTSFTNSVRAASVCIGVCLSYLQRPALADALMTGSETNALPIPSSITTNSLLSPAVSDPLPSPAVANSLLSPAAPYPQSPRRGGGSLESGGQVSPRLERLLQRLLRVCCLCECVLLQVVPSLSQLLTGELALDLQFSASQVVKPSLVICGADQLSYGSLLACATLCCQHVVRDRPVGVARASAQCSVVEVQLSRPVALACLQQALLLVLSQARFLLLQHCHAARPAPADSADLPLVCRDLHAELTALVESCSKRQRRSFSMSPMPARTANAGSLSVDEQCFMAVIARVSSLVLK